MNWESLLRIATASIIGVSFIIWLLGIAATLIEASHIVKPPTVEARR